MLNFFRRSSIYSVWQGSLYEGASCFSPSKSTSTISFPTNQSYLQLKLLCYSILKIILTRKYPEFACLNVFQKRHLAGAEKGSVSFPSSHICCTCSDSSCVRRALQSVIVSTTLTKPEHQIRGLSGRSMLWAQATNIREFSCLLRAFW